MRAAGYVAQAVALLSEAGIEAFAFHDFTSNPDNGMIEAGRVFASAHAIDSLIGLGGGSSSTAPKASTSC
jgi:alcohol dehydrogenase class IV